MNLLSKSTKRARVIFQLIGNDQVGMGHIYRALSIAREMEDREVLFVCNADSKIAVNNLLSKKYWLGVYDPSEIVKKIIELEPDLLINDILDTEAEDIVQFRKSGAAVVNFEDLGTGATESDLTINELYDRPQFVGGNVLWGHNYFFVREEFESTRPNCFKPKVERVLLTFGGTDQHNLSELVYDHIKDVCKKHAAFIHIVTGPGYRNYYALKEKVTREGNASITHSTGVISRIMADAQIAITSNGRTVYELAHMNVPTVVIPQHEREKTHSFAMKEHGFIPMDTYKKSVTEELVCKVLESLLTDTNYRLELFKKMLQFSFEGNKQTVLNRILRLI